MNEAGGAERFRLGLGIFTSAMRWSADPLAELQEIVQLAEQLGFDFVAFPQHLSIPPESVAALGRNWRDPLILSAATLATTTRITAVTTVVVAPLYSEALLRQAAATLSWLGQGRFELGLGAGYLRADFESDEHFVDRFRLLHAAVASLHERVPSLPLWIGGGSGRAAALARRLGATWAPSTSPLATVREQIAAGIRTVPTTDWLAAEQARAEVERWQAAGAAGLVLRLNERSPAALVRALKSCAPALPPPRQ